MSSDPRYVVLGAVDYALFLDKLSEVRRLDIFPVAPDDLDVIVVGPVSPTSTSATVTPDVHAAIEMVAMELSAVNSYTLSPADIYAALFMASDTLRSALDQTLACLVSAQGSDDPSGMLILSSKSKLAGEWMNRNMDRLNVALKKGYELFRRRIESKEKG